jgi:hypothetical protein
MNKQLREPKVDKHIKWEKFKASLPRLFKESKIGATQVWDIWLELVNESGDLVELKRDLLSKRLPHKWHTIITTRFGQLDGKLQNAPVEITEGKNIGRSNETNVFSQAVLEMVSDWTKKQKRKGYHASQAAIKQVKARPMLLDKYVNYKHYLDFNDPDGVWVQEKLDGVRVMVHWDTGRQDWVFCSREGNEYYHLKHIKQELNKLKFLKQNPQMYLDGELFSREVSFNKIVSLCKKIKTLSAEQEDEQKKSNCLSMISLTYRNQICHLCGEWRLSINFLKWI